ncbi:MAG: hypothetical protein HDS65_00590 [Bacteroidales bacterium]|nr:hypothetical protein [Bacteroidales bacterium]
MLPLAAIAVGACSEKDEPIRPSAVPATPGAAIDFSVAATPGSRTYYTDDDKYQMDWLDADEIHLFSDKAKAQTGTNLLGQAQYQTGNVAAGYSVSIVDGHDYHANLTLKDKYPLQWPDKFDDTEVFTFSGAYPLSRRHSHNPNGESVEYEMYYLTNQRVSVNTKSAAGEYTTIPDMKNAYLMARDTVVPTGQHVLLHFNPIMTTLDVHIHAHSDDHEIGTGIINGMKITGVSIIMPNRLQHGNNSKPTFTYDLTRASNHYNIEGGKLGNDLIKDCPQAVYVGIDNGADPYVMLNEGESLSLMAFLPPVKGDDMKGTKVKIHTAGAYDFVVKLPNKDWIEEGRIDIDLPNLDPDRNLGNAWMKNLPGNMYMTRLSLPGAECDAGTTGADVTRWLRAGVRVLDMCKADESKWVEIRNAVADFLKDNLDEFGNRTEFVMVWGDGNAENSDFTKNWTEDDRFGKECAFADENESINLERMRLKLDARTVEAARKLGVLVFKKRSDNNIHNVAHSYSGSGHYINTTNISRASNISDIKISSKKWNIDDGSLNGSSALSQVYYIDKALNLDVAKHLASARNDESTGCAGIVMIPFAGQAFDNDLNQVYGDVLLQTVIDCNYKFIIDLK